MARTPAAQAFGELGEGTGEWRGILLENGQMVVPFPVPPALVLAKHAKCRGGDVSSAGESFFLVCSISTHAVRKRARKSTEPFSGKLFLRTISTINYQQTDALNCSWASSST